MNETTAIIVLVCCLACAAWAHINAWQLLSVRERLPLFVFSGSYVITSAIGATIIGILGIEYLEEIKFGLATESLHEIGSVKYWFLVYLPLIIPPMMVSFLGSSPKAKVAARPLLAQDLCFPSTFVVVLAASVLFCIYCLKASGFSVSLSSWGNLASEFSDLMALRSEIRESAGFLFFRIVYVALPALSFAALYQAWKHRTATWMVLFGISALATAWLGLATIQKSLLLVYLGSLAIGLVVLKVAKVKHLVAVALIGCTLLTIMQQFFVGEWTFAQSVSHIVIRVGITFPYYASLYPDYLPYEGIDFGLWVAGIGDQPTDNVDVFRCMYPDVNHVVGHVGAPAHLRMFAQCGMAGSIGSLVLIGCGISLIARMSHRIAGPISFAIYVQALVTVYFVTQTGLVDMIFSSTGMPWCFLTLGPIWLATDLIRSRKPSLVPRVESSGSVA